MELAAVRTFLAVVDAGQFQEAAAELSISQQAVSKRVAALEKDLGVRLFDRTPRGSQLTIDGQAFLPHARDLLHAAERAANSVRPDRRALRVDVINSRIGPAQFLRDFHRAHPEIALDVVTNIYDAGSSNTALQAGIIDAAFRAVTAPVPGLDSVRVLDEPHELLTGPAHALAGAAVLTPAELVGHRIWMPGLTAGTEWTAYYDEFAAAFGLSIDAAGPNFGSQAMLEKIAASPGVATLMGEYVQLAWPAEHDLRRIPLSHPTPVYPHSLVWRTGNPHPALATLREFLGSARANLPGETWTPSWARPLSTPRRSCQ